MIDQEEIAGFFMDALEQKGLHESIAKREAEKVRACRHCRRLMSEGWLYQGTETYCSDQCLQAAHPELDIEQLRQDAEKEGCEAYWKHW